MALNILSGVWVAGIDAGKVYNTFPDMNGIFFSDKDEDPSITEKLILELTKSVPERIAVFVQEGNSRPTGTRSFLKKRPAYYTMHRHLVSISLTFYEQLLRQ